MKTKNIFKALALAMLMPAMLLTTACSSDDDAINNDDHKKGFVLPVTVNVTREGDATTRATYNESTKKLSFSSGDKLYVKGSQTSGGEDLYAGVLTWTSGGTFTGTITTEKPYTGSAEELLAASIYVNAVLLPNGYENYHFISIKKSGYETGLYLDATHAFATSKSAAVEQLSYESHSNVLEYSSGFILKPQNAILNFTITGLPPNTNVTATLTRDYYGSNVTTSGNVETNASGTATFAMGVIYGQDLKDFSLTVGGKAITLVSSEKILERGHIYNITRSATPALTYPIALNEVTSDYVGSVITSDGYVYATASDATAASKTAVAMICYVGDAGSADASTGSEAYKGLALALSDAGTGKWCSQHSVNCLTTQYNSGQQTNDMAGIANTDYLIDHDPDGHGHTAASVARNYAVAHPTGTSVWFLPSAGQWDKMVNACKNALGTNNDYKDLRDGFETRGGTNMLKDYYRTSTENTIRFAFRFDFSTGNNGNLDYKYLNSCVRPAFAF